MASSSGKRKRNVLTIEKKLQILQRLEKGESAISLAKIYNVGNATISGIKRSRESILEFASKLDSEDGSKKRKTMRDANNTALESAVYAWFLEKRSQGEPVSGPLLCEKALELSSTLGGPSDFKASTGWLKNFKSRHGIRGLHAEDEPLSSDTPSAISFTQTFTEFTDEEGYSRDVVYNAEETGITWRTIPGKSLGSKRELVAPRYKVSKNRTTASGIDAVSAELATDEDSDEGEEEERNQGPTHSEAFAALETAMKWFKQQPESCPTELLLLKRIRDLAANKHIQTSGIPSHRRYSV